MKNFFSSPTVMGILTMFIFWLIAIISGVSLISAIFAGIFACIAVIIFSGRFPARLRNFYPIYGYISIGIFSLLVVLIIADILSGLPQIGMIVGSERNNLVQSEVFQQEVLGEMNLALGAVETHGSLRQANRALELIESGKIDDFQLFWSGDSLQAEPLHSGASGKWAITCAYGYVF